MNNETLMFVDRAGNTNDFAPLLPNIKCRDGFEISVQASRTHHCEPKCDNGPYAKVEMGFPNFDDDILSEWAEDPTYLTDTVYGYVPVSAVADMIVRHGGYDPNSYRLDIRDGKSMTKKQLVLYITLSLILTAMFAYGLHITL